VDDPDVRMDNRTGSDEENEQFADDSEPYRVERCHDRRRLKCIREEESEELRLAAKSDGTVSRPTERQAPGERRGSRPCR
jgi:hypothetical protein